ncbi:MAG TPA: cytochrome ubiquinol oxidase subunit I [Planctomycetota bacterium]|nr:cytochrome ubiquinol oxidase subunit I [Planctomycetota bacterium]
MNAAALLPPGDAALFAARLQMAFTLGFHVVLACLGVGLPVLLLVAEGRFLRTRDEGWRTLARRWSKAFGVLFAVGAVSGTVLSFEIGILWPRFVAVFGPVIGFPFTLEAFAFFLEAIFLGLYLYGWDRLTPQAHWWCGVPVAAAGLASAWFVVTANAWMNAPAGFRLDGDALADADPVAAMRNPAAGAQTTHMILAAYVVTGFLVASVYAAARLRGEERPYHRRARALGLAMGCLSAPAQILAGDFAARVVARTQPVKFAAMEGQFQTEARAPLRLGGIPDEERGETRFALEIPGALSWLAHRDADVPVRGLDSVPAAERPPIAIVHLAFQSMIASGVVLLALSAWAGWTWLRRRRIPESRAFARALLVAGPLSILATEAGWIVTEVGRQPWIVQGVMRTADAAAGSPRAGWILAATLAVYAVIGVGSFLALRRLARRPLPA